jgi:polyisoprenoid-binding protein YceI
VSVKTLLVAAVLLIGLVRCTAELYKIDPSNSFITFSVEHLGLNSVKGKFRDFEGAIVLDNGVISEARATIRAKSVDTGVRRRDDRLRSADFFDAFHYPTITFKTERITKNRVYGKRHNMWDGGITVIGYPTMHGVTRELQFTAKQSGPVKDPSGKMRIGFEAKTNLRRQDYGINFDQVLETGALVVGEDVEIELNVQAIMKDLGSKSR